MRRTRLISIGFMIASLVLAACSTTSQRSAIAPTLPGAQAVSQQSQASPPRLITMNSRTGRLEAWPIRRGGGSDPEPFTPPLNLGNASPLETIGDVVVMAGAFPSRVVLYNTTSGTTRTLNDPFGTPIAIAVGKDATIFALNVAKNGSPIAMYQPPAHRAVELNCSVMPSGEALAVDNEGDIFIQGYPRNSIYSIAEIPNGPNGPEPQNCKILPLETNPGYVAGVAIDPKTDSLLTLDDPSLCAGGEEGRLTIYPKPYNQNTGHSKDIGLNCTGGLWLNGDSTIVFTSDQDVSGSFSFILQRSYPGGGDMGIYNASNFAGIAPMPSTLPN